MNSRPTAFLDVCKSVSYKTAALTKLSYGPFAAYILLLVFKIVKGEGSWIKKRVLLATN